MSMRTYTCYLDLKSDVPYTKNTQHHSYNSHEGAQTQMHTHTAFKKGSQQIRAVTEVVIGHLRAFEGAREIASGSVCVGARMSF